MIPDRIKPDPLPKIEPQWEYSAEGSLRKFYEDYKTKLQVPWVGVFALAYARHRPFFDTWWEGVRDVVDTTIYIETAARLRREIEDTIEALDPPPIRDRLLTAGYSDRELDNIRDIIEFLSHGNFTQLPAGFVPRLLLEGGSFGGNDDALEKYGRSHAVTCETPFVLMEPHHVQGDTRSLYEDVKERLELPFVNTDYRALTRWPTYFEMAWGDLRKHVGGEAHEKLSMQMHASIFEATAALPNPGNLTADALTRAADTGNELARVRDTTRLFTHLIPGLMVNVAFFRHQLL